VPCSLYWFGALEGDRYIREEFGNLIRDLVISLTAKCLSAAQTSSMRDMQMDWKQWSPIERIVATMLLGIASFLAGALVYLQS
jgi:hypothetical protein